jgi:hypothetical protein
MFFQNNSDFMFSVAKEGDDADLRGKITCLKMKDDEGQWSQKVEYTKILLANGKSSLVVSKVCDDDTKKAQPEEPELTKDEATFYRILYDAGTAGLPVEQWNAAAKEAGLGVKRRSDLFDLRKSLQDKGRVREYAGKWRVNHYG